MLYTQIITCTGFIIAFNYDYVIRQILVYELGNIWVIKGHIVKTLRL